MIETVLATETEAFCKEWLVKFPGQYDEKLIKDVCAQAKVLEGCHSQLKRYPLFHYDRSGQKTGKKILVFALVHGDEIPAGSLARQWIERLSRLENPRNNWRVVPIVNPEGVEAISRTNGRGVDLNRNMPTVDWNEQAHRFWKENGKKSSRRYPGETAGSEQETICKILHLQDYKPDFVISIHTPYGLLDFDGPKMGANHFKNLPWKRLGHYPGSLGRYVWHERKIPTLTIELKGNTFNLEDVYMDDLQDVAGSMATKI